MDGIKQVPQPIRQTYAVVAELEEHFPGRRFTPDGHLVGSIGEVLAAYHYGLTLLPASTGGHDAITEGGRPVQVKVTQRPVAGARATAESVITRLLTFLRQAQMRDGKISPAMNEWRLGKENGMPGSMDHKCLSGPGMVPPCRGRIGMSSGKPQHSPRVVPPAILC
jgi:hypothetical protein